MTLPAERWFCVLCGTEPAAQPPADYKPERVRHRDGRVNSDYSQWDKVIAAAQQDLSNIAALEGIDEKVITAYTERGQRVLPQKARAALNRIAQESANPAT